MENLKKIVEKINSDLANSKFKYMNEEFTFKKAKSISSSLSIVVLTKERSLHLAQHEAPHFLENVEVLSIDETIEAYAEQNALQSIGGGTSLLDKLNSKWENLLDDFDNEESDPFEIEKKAKVLKSISDGVLAVQGVKIAMFKAIHNNRNLDEA